MTDLPDPTRARADPAEVERTQPAEVEAAAEVDGLQPGLTRQTDLEQASRQLAGPHVRRAQPGRRRAPRLGDRCR